MMLGSVYLELLEAAHDAAVFLAVLLLIRTRTLMMPHPSLTSTDDPFVLLVLLNPGRTRTLVKPFLLLQQEDDLFANVVNLSRHFVGMCFFQLD